MIWQGAIVRVWNGLPGKNGKFVGTAFFIDSKTLLTARHVVENSEQGIYLDGTPGGGKEKIEAENIYLCDRDVAVLITSRPFLNTPTLSFTAKEVEIGQSVTLAGYLDETQSLHSLRSEISGHVSTLNTWRTHGNISKGMSGGPVIDLSENKIIGIIQARDEDKNLNYLIPVGVLVDCLQKIGLKDSLPKAPLFNVPSLPPHYLERNEHVNKIKKLLLQNSGKNVGITGISKAVGLQGMGGIGKSILAAGIAYDEQIRYGFPDGVVWITVGQNLDIIGAQKIVLEIFDIFDINLATPEEGLNLLNKYLVDKKILLILDDVWVVNDLHFFDISSAKSKVLVTTRHKQVLKGIGAEECRIDTLSYHQSIELLRVQSGWGEEDLPSESTQIITECGALPLAISMIGAMLKGKPQSRWQQVLQYLQNAELKSIRQKFVNYPYPDLFVALHVGVIAQPEIIQKLYLSLVVFSEEVLIPESVLETYWENDNLHRQEILGVIDELLDASLIFRYDDTKLKLHDLQRDYIHSQCKDVKQHHIDFVNSFMRILIEKRFDSIHQYFVNNFDKHFIKADKGEQISTTAALLLEKDSLDWNNVLRLSWLANMSIESVARSVIKTNFNWRVIYNCLQILGREAKEDAIRLLKQKNQHPEVINACLRLLGEEAKEDARRLLRQDNQYPVIINTCIRLLGEEAKEDARRLLRQERQNPEVINLCLKLLGAEVKEDARLLLRQENQHPLIINTCLLLLDTDAKEDARLLLRRENQNPEVINNCLKLLGEEVKEDARLFLKQENQHPVIINACLKLLGEEAKEEARLLLRQKNQHREVINNCLNLLGKEAREDARLLLRQENQIPEVINTCLSLLGKEAKGDARQLLRQKNQHPEVINACLNLLGKEAKEDARRLLNQENQHPVIINTCLNLLGAKAKEDARLLLRQEDQNPAIINTCLKLLGTEVKEDARLLLKQKNQHPEVIITCLKLLGTEAKEDARRLLIQENQHREVINACLNLLGAEAAGFEKELEHKKWESLKLIKNIFGNKLGEKQALEILQDWRKYDRELVTTALNFFRIAPHKATKSCKDILRYWEFDYEYYSAQELPKYSGHIIKAMSHPELRNEAKLTAFALLKKEEEQPGFLDKLLLEYAQDIIDGFILDWSENVE